MKKKYEWSHKNQYKWQPKNVHNKTDIELVKALIDLSEKLDIDKSHLTRMALINLVNASKTNTGKKAILNYTNWTTQMIRIK